MPSVITSTPAHKQVISLCNTIEDTRIKIISSLKIGETLNVRVLGTRIDHKTLLQVKNSILITENPLHLPDNALLTVQVEQLHPTIILRATPSKNISNTITNESLKTYRSRPDALKDMIVSILDHINGENIKELTNDLTKTDFQNITKILGKIIISKENIIHPHFLKDSLVALGLSRERQLMKGLSDPTILTEEHNRPTLKSTLMQLSSELSSILTTHHYSEKQKEKIRQFANLADHGTTVIESIQIVNIMAQEQDGLFIFQIPFLFSDRVRMQDIFVETGCKKNGHRSGADLRIVLFLNMDALGELAIDVHIYEKSIFGLLKCSDPHVLDFINKLLPELQSSLAGLNYAESRLQCLLEKNIDAWENDYIRSHPFFSQNVVDVCI